MSSTRIFLFTALIFALCSSAYSQVSRGIVNEGLTIKSKILKEDVRYTIYLPYDYKTSNRYYPVVYLLHGYTDNDMGWMQFGEAHMIADEAIGHREVPPMILVMPDGGVSFYINNYDNSVRYEDFFIEEFVPYIESKYRIRSEKRYRGVAGLSMGGFGALIYALKHPDMFAACAAFSAGIFAEEEIINMNEELWTVMGRLYGPKLKGKARITEHLLSNSPIHLVQNTDLKKSKAYGCI